ncbi:hypothetical protein KW803_00230 [Candidatus Saccharibacteria bacterium]|nr:hypothetical protein [Candidatus Saccharibacteria bacterium]
MTLQHVRREGHNLRVQYVFIHENRLRPDEPVDVRPPGLPGGTGIVFQNGNVTWGELSRFDEGILPYSDEQMDMFDPVVRWTIGLIARLCPLEQFSYHEDWCILLTNREVTMKFADNQVLEDSAPHVEWMLSEMIAYLKRQVFVALV